MFTVELEAFRADSRGFGLDRILDALTVFRRATAGYTRADLPPALWRANEEGLRREFEQHVERHREMYAELCEKTARQSFGSPITIGNDAPYVRLEAFREARDAVVAVEAHNAGRDLDNPIHDRMGDGAFEEAIAELLRRDGHHAVERSGGAGVGADVSAETELGSRIVVQCKRYHRTRSVGSPDVQRFAGTCFAVHRADLALLVTTSTFTKAAVTFADRVGIVLVDGAGLALWQMGEYDPAAGL
ncbi:restriction endonuclease [Kitasatospora sp. LaBMicrA B282]|uniref:restriction endonuclease n=1 Tax=Kitasatospora sp. LaBMicrA B282 TaxID=3420949 RepID=UPI003D09F6E2